MFSDEIFKGSFWMNISVFWVIFLQTFDRESWIDNRASLSLGNCLVLNSEQAIKKTIMTGNILEKTVTLRNRNHVVSASMC